MRTDKRVSNGHKWIRNTGKVIIEGKEMYRTYTCSRCNVTGKVFFPSTLVTIDNVHFLKEKHIKCKSNGKKKKKAGRTK